MTTSTPTDPPRAFASCESCYAAGDLAAARAEVVDLHTAQLDDSVRARQDAEQRADEATMRADAVEEKLADALAALEDLRTTRESWTHATEQARAEAKAAQAEAQTATATLAETQSALVSAQETQSATTAVVADLRSERASWMQAAEAARTDAQTAVAALAEAQGELTALRAVLAQQQAVQVSDESGDD
ncbi:hypothetical protein A8M60_11965 [Nocardia farcinica]|nr:hypothetical protein A8M60_11965 [Nocardia farcinica]